MPTSGAGGVTYSKNPLPRPAFLACAMCRFLSNPVCLPGWLAAEFEIDRKRINRQEAHAVFDMPREAPFPRHVDGRMRELSNSVYSCRLKPAVMALRKNRQESTKTDKQRRHGKQDAAWAFRNRSPTR
jgi:hypothetical protein